MDLLPTEACYDCMLEVDKEWGEYFKAIRSSKASFVFHVGCYDSQLLAFLTGRVSNIAMSFQHLIWEGAPMMAAKIAKMKLNWKENHLCDMAHASFYHCLRQPILDLTSRYLERMTPFKDSYWGAHHLSTDSSDAIAEMMLDWLILLKVKRLILSPQSANLGIYYSDFSYVY